MIKIEIVVFMLVICAAGRAQDSSPVILSSPNNLLTMTLTLEADGALTYDLRASGKTVLDRSALSLEINGKDIKHFHILGLKTTSRDTTWRPLYGERRAIRDHYNQIEVDLVDDAPVSLTLTGRCYDEGFAFRFTIPQQQTAAQITLNERCQFSFDKNYPAWAVYRAQGEYEKTPISKIKPGCERPLVVKLARDLYAAIGEAGLVDYARMKFQVQSKKDFTLVSQLDGDVEAALPMSTPWRYILVGDSPGALLQSNYVLLNLNEPSRIKETSWIKPGKVIRDVTLTTQGGLACVDFCAAHNMQYVEFDAGWYGPEHDPQADARTITVDSKRSPGPLDLHRVIDYAREKDVGVILYVNRRAMEKQLDEILPLYQSWGVAGVKYGFVNVGSQEWTTWLHDAVGKAAAHNLMVDIHDEYRPTGVSRTWPNLMTQEGVRGDEESPTNAHTLITLFTRMIAGAADNTICYFAERVDEKMGSHASQLAKAVCLYSPWQFLYWYDRPEQSPRKKGGAGSVTNWITEEPELEFFDRLPTVWDDTRVLEGEIGRFAAVARRSNDQWFIGCINGEHAHEFDLGLDFLETDRRYVAVIYSDDARMTTRTRVRIERCAVDSRMRIKRTVLANNGLAIRLRPAENGENLPPLPGN